MNGVCVFCAKPGNQYNVLAFDDNGRLAHISRSFDEGDPWVEVRCKTLWEDEACEHDGVECVDLDCSIAPGYAACARCQLAKPVGQLFHAEQHMSMDSEGKFNRVAYRPAGTDVPWGFRIPSRFAWMDDPTAVLPKGTRIVIVEALDKDPYVLCEDCAIRTHYGVKPDGNGYERLDRSEWKTLKARGVIESPKPEKTGDEDRWALVPTEAGVTIKQAMDLFAQGDTRTRAILAAGEQAGVLKLTKVSNPDGRGGKPMNVYVRVAG